MPDPDSKPPLGRLAPHDLGQTNGLSPDQISKWADRIADGRDEFPADLPEPDRSLLADAVRTRIRNRLVRHVARAIAGRLVQPSPTATEE